MICNAPIVEGAVMAATEASGGAAEGCRGDRARTVAGVNEQEADDVGDSSAQVLMTHDVGLHARPSVKFTKLAKTFAADVELRAAEGPWIDAKSIVKVMAAKAPKGTMLHLRAGGEGAQRVAALVALVEHDFDEARGRSQCPDRLG